MSTTTAPTINSDVKNFDLADLGKKRIEWANQSMKVLQIIRKEFIKNQPLKGIRVSACLHVTAETANLMIALRDGGAAQLASVSEEFERLGDLVAAVDAVAQAALTYRRQGRRGSALGCSTRAAALAEQCGASTSALRQAGEPLPLTDREREIVMLIGEGLSSREIAERLTLSVRTVESHVYRAMLKTGTTSRDELATLLPRPRARTQ